MEHISITHIYFGLIKKYIQSLKNSRFSNIIFPYQRSEVINFNPRLRIIASKVF